MPYWLSCFMACITIAYLILCAWLMLKVAGGDVTLGEALRVWVPLAVCYGLAFMAGVSYPTLAVVPGLAGLAYGVRLLLQQRAAVRESLNEMLDREVEKWRQTVLADDRHAYGHLMLGSALVERRDYDEALVHYRKALQQDPAYARDLDLFLGGRRPAEERRLRARLPDLEELTRRRRGAGAAQEGPWKE